MRTEPQGHGGFKNRSRRREEAELELLQESASSRRRLRRLGRLNPPSPREQNLVFSCFSWSIQSMKPDLIARRSGLSFRTSPRLVRLLAVIGLILLGVTAALLGAPITIGIIGDYGAAYAGAIGTSNEQAVANL